MSTSSFSFFSNSFPTEKGASEGNIFRLDSLPIMPVGSRLTRSDGNIYRYAKFEETGYGPGYLMAPDHSAQFMKDSDNTVVAGTASLSGTDGNIGTYRVQITKASVTQNQYSGGYLVITGDIGVGYTYRIRGNSASDASSRVIITLWEPLQVALSATSDLAIIGSLYNNLVKADAKAVDDNIVSGVSIVTTTSTYMWAYLQTWGVCGVYMGTAVTGSAGALCSRIGDQISLYGSTGAPSGSSGYAVWWPPQMAGTEAQNVLASNFFNGKYPIGFCLDVGDAAGLTTVYIQIAA